MDEFKRIFKDLLKKKYSCEEEELEKQKLWDLFRNHILSLPNQDKIFFIESLLYFYPKNHLLYYYLGCIYNEMNDTFRALTWFKVSYIHNSSFIENLLDLCKILFDRDYDVELSKYLNEESYQLFKDDHRFLLLYGNYLYKTDKIYLALEMFEKVLKNDNLAYLTNVESLTSVPNVLRYDIRLSIVNTYGKILATLHRMEEAQSVYLEELYKSIEYKNNNKTINPYFIYDLQSLIYSNFIINLDYFYINDNEDIQKKYYSLIEDINPYQPSYDFTGWNIKNKKNKKRIGLLTSDLFFHAVSNFIIPIIENINKDNYEIIIFYNNDNLNHNQINTEYTIHHVYHKNTKELSDFIYNSKIDILFDLNGHTKHHRLDVFSMKPSPIQVSYLGFPNTTGLKTIDYRITDSICDPEDTTQYYSEKLIRLPKSFLLFKSILQDKNPILLLNEERKNDYQFIHLGMMNKTLKNSENFMLCVKKILSLLPQVKLFIKMDTNNIDDNHLLLKYKEFFSPYLNQIEFIHYCSNIDYFKLMYNLDILLDTFPYSGTTTTCNALHNSLPVVSLYKKNSHVHCVSSSLLIHSGFPSLVTYSEDEYIQKVIHLSTHVDELIELKKNIGKGFHNLMNEKEFIKGFEEILERMYEDSS